jgi:hypothetical protein
MKRDGFHHRQASQADKWGAILGGSCWMAGLRVMHRLHEDPASHPGLFLSHKQTQDSAAARHIRGTQQRLERFEIQGDT